MITIILRAKNEMPYLAETLRMFRQQSRQDFELICVDSGSRDGGWELLQKTDAAKVYQISPESYIPGKVLNEAISYAKGDIIVFNNADAIPQDDFWLDKLVKPLEEDPQLVAVYANQLPRKDASPIVIKDYQRAFGDGKVAAKWRHFFSLASSAVRADAIREHPFNESLNYSEDIEWSWRMKKQGFKIAYVQDAIVEHSHNYNLKQIAKRYKGEGVAEAFIYRDIYEQDGSGLSFGRSVLAAAIAEILRDVLYLLKVKKAAYIPKAKLYRFAQRYYAWKGRTSAFCKAKNSKKKILMSCLAFDEGKSGIADYIISVTAQFIKEHEVYLLIHPSDKEIFPLRDENLHFIEISETLKKPILSMLWHLFILPYWPSLKRYDLIFLPAANRRLFCKYNSRTIVTFHDLSQFHIPGKYDFLRMLYIRRIVGHYLHKAPRIYAISESTKYDLRRYYGIPGNRIHVNYNGYDPNKLLNPVARAELEQKYGFKGDYFLYIARIEHPGKNHLNLLKAYEKLPDSIKQRYCLVLGGSMWNGGEVVKRYWEKMKDKDRVCFAGFVSKGDLAGLYKHASLYVFPSLYEGFGIPMLEAFASGVPVLCSNTSSLPEIGKNAVLTFNPNKPKEISSAIQTIISNPSLYEELKARAYKRLEAFSWERHAKRLLETLATP
jgi:glycosyltransferase involved in cell wall biosynthesis/GT2 family glycosyltransferase